MLSKRKATDIGEVWGRRVPGFRRIPERAAHRETEESPDPAVVLRQDWSPLWMTEYPLKKGWTVCRSFW